MWFIQYEKLTHEVVEVMEDHKIKYHEKTRSSFHSAITSLPPSQWYQETMSNLSRDDGRISFDLKITFAIKES